MLGKNVIEQMTREELIDLLSIQMDLNEAMKKFMGAHHNLDEIRNDLEKAKSSESLQMIEYKFYSNMEMDFERGLDRKYNRDVCCKNPG